MLSDPPHKDLDVLLDAVSKTTSFLRFVSWFLREKRYMGFRLAEGETLERHLDSFSGPGAAELKANFERVSNIRFELRECLDALDKADPAGIQRRRELRGLSVNAAISYPRFRDESTDPAYLSRFPTVSLECNRTPEAIDAMAGELGVLWKELFAIKQHGQKTPLEPEKTLSQTGETSRRPNKPKRSTSRGDAKEKVEAAFCQHHQYDDGGCLNYEPIGSNELARKADVSEGTASEFFSKWFGDHGAYRAMCANGSKLVGKIKQIRGEYSPDELYGKNPEDYPDPIDDD